MVIWESIDMTARIRKAMDDINDEDFWKALYFILQCVWPALCALWLGDSNRPGMHVIYYLSHLTSVHINNSAAEFKNSGLSLFLGEIVDDNDDNDNLSEGQLSDDETLPDDE